MNGIEKILQRLNTESQTAVNAVLSEAKEKAAALRAKNAAEVESLSAELRLQGERAATEREERLVSVAQMEARKIVLAAKQTVMNMAFDEALEKMCKASDEQYAETCAKLLAKASPEGAGEVIFAKDAKSRVGEKAVKMANELIGNGKLKLSSETRPIKGGFILVKGVIEVNCTYEALVRLQKGEALGEVAKLLFPES